MKKNAIQLLALGCAAIVLGGVYVGLSTWNKYSKEQKQEKEAREEEAAKIYLCSMEQADTLNLENENGSFSFTYNEDEESWSYDKDEKFPLKQSSVTSITGKLKSLEAVRRLDGADGDLSVYGLDDPSYRVTVSDADSNTVALLIGSSSEASGDYYVKLDGEDTVYTVGSAFVNTLSLTEDAMLEKESFPSITQSAVTEVSWTKDGKQTVYRKESRIAEEETTEEASAEDVSTEEVSAAEEESTEEVSAAEEEGTEEATTAEPQTVEVWVKDDGKKNSDLKEDTAIDTLLAAVTGLTFEDCADYYMEDEELAEYGFDDEAKTMILTVSYTSGEEEKETTLTIGAKNEDETAWYARIDDSRMVNLISDETVQSLIDGFEQLSE